MGKTTYAMDKAMALAARNGAVFAGKGNVTDSAGHMQTISAVTLLALERMGFMVIHTGPDGGLMARLTDDGRKHMAGE
jgi:hypothetical protein